MEWSIHLHQRENDTLKIRSIGLWFHIIDSQSSEKFRMCFVYPFWTDSSFPLPKSKHPSLHINAAAEVDHQMCACLDVCVYGVSDIQTHPFVGWFITNEFN